jgi:uncharacterized membrane protein YagU involved in acid resistance
LYEKNLNFNGIQKEAGYSMELLHKIPSIYFLAKLDPVVDVKKIQEKFSNLEVHLEESFGHLDFLWSIEGCRVVDEILTKKMEEIATWEL